MSPRANDHESSIDYDVDPRWISALAKSLPSWSIRSACTVLPESPQCILSLVSCCRASVLAASLSDFSVTIHDPENLQQIARLTNHTDHVRAIRPLPDSSSLFTASEDGTWKLVDLRTGSVQITVKTHLPFYSFDCNGVLAVAGQDVDGDILLWDIRKCAAELAILDEVHTDEVRAVRFHPEFRSIVFTGSIDCLINKIDLTAIAVDDCLAAVYNTNQAVRSFDFFGPRSEYLYSISEIETLSLCNTSSDDIISTMDQICPALSADFSVRYLIDCCYDASTSCLSVFAGNYYGDMIGAVVSPDKLDTAATLLYGHSSGVRALSCINNVLYTAGEDSRITSWRHNNI